MMQTLWALFLVACCCSLCGVVRAQPAAVHVSFFFSGFPLTAVPDDQFVPDINGLHASPLLIPLL